MLKELFKNLATSLNKSNVPYLIIGGQAALIYRDARFTNDVDITLGIGSEDFNIIIDLSNELNFKILAKNPYEFVRQTLVLPVYDEENDYRIDFIFSYTQFEKDAISRANIIDFEGVDINFASLEDLIILKIFSGRNKDLDDVKNIIKKNKNYNSKMIIENLKELGDAIEIDLVGRFNNL